MTWATVYEVDWRDAHAALGTVNLNSPGATFTHDGVAWTTPAVANGNPIDQRTSVLWELNATGLQCQSPANSRFNAANNSAPHIYTTLEELAANTATPFDSDPSRSLILQCYVSAGVYPTATDAGAMMGLYKLDFGTTLGNANVAASALGSRLGLNPINFGVAGVGTNPEENERTDLALNVPTIKWTNGARIDFFAAPFDVGADAWPSNALLRYIGTYKTVPDFDNDVIQNPDTFRIANVHNAPTFSPNAYDATIQRFRVLQEQ